MGALVSRSLPEYSGPLDVGVQFLEYAIPPERIGRFRRKGGNGAVGLEIASVKFTLFYPCGAESRGKRGTKWFSKFRDTIDGFLAMARITNPFLRYTASWPIIWGVKFPAYLDAPPLRSEDKWPVIIFSHGAGSPSLMYTHLWGELASRGHVVVAMEHRDGTCPGACFTNDQFFEEAVPWLRWTELEWPFRNTLPLDDNTLRHEQLKIRLHEMASALDTLQALNRGELLAGRLSAACLNPFKQEMWRSLLNIEADVVLMGHSFGGTAAIAASVEPRFVSVNRVVVFDPAIQRIEPWTSRIKSALSCINSESYISEPDNIRLARLSTWVDNEIYIGTVFGATHASFTDTFLLLPRFVARLCGLKGEPLDVFRTTLEQLRASAALPSTSHARNPRSGN